MNIVEPIEMKRSKNSGNALGFLYDFSDVKFLWLRLVQVGGGAVRVG